MRQSKALAPGAGSPELLSRARALLRDAQTLPELLQVRNIANAAQRYFKAAAHSRTMAQEAAQIRLHAERKAGQMLMGMAERGERTKGGGNVAELQRATQLRDLGVEKTQSHRWQQIAKVDEPLFEQYIASCAENEKAEFTTEGLFRYAKEHARQDHRDENERIVSGAAPAENIDGQFSAIVIDPPWDWGDEGDQDQLGRARPTYATMPFQEIITLPVAALAAADAHLYLWITNRSLPKGFELLERWGFRYITALTWCKPSFGMGNYFRGSTEHILFGVRGSLELLVRDQGTWFNAPRGRGHSTKPTEFYALVERCSPGPWLEMFARSKRNGWTSWGAEADE